MPDLFQAKEDPARDNRFRDSKVVAEPFIAPEASIPLAPTLRQPKYTRMHIFTSYCELPPNITFENQEEDENILILLRRSFITNIGWLIFSFILALIPFFLTQFLPTILLKIPFHYVLMGILFYFLLVLSYIFVSFITWYFNINLITNKRIVDIDFEELVYKNVAETKLSLVQDVSYTQVGAIRTLTDYGDVLIQTAGAIDNFDLTAVPKPERVVNVVEDLIGKGRATYA